LSKQLFDLVVVGHLLGPWSFKCSWSSWSPESHCTPFLLGAEKRVEGLRTGDGSVEERRVTFAKFAMTLREKKGRFLEVKIV
jgi:hypothetical protein